MSNFKCQKLIFFYKNKQQVLEERFSNVTFSLPGVTLKCQGDALLLKAVFILL